MLNAANQYNIHVSYLILINHPLLLCVYFIIKKQNTSKIFTFVPYLVDGFTGCDEGLF